MTRLRAAVLGLNHYHVTGWVESLGVLGDRVEIVARYDPDPTRRDRSGPDHVDPSLSSAFPAGFADVPFNTDLDRVIADHRPDIALVTLPNVDAPAAIERLARAGVHLLIDKPAARTGDEAERAFDVVDAAGVMGAVALTHRYSAGWREVAALIASGGIGRLLTTEALFTTSSVAVRNAANGIFDKHGMGGGVMHWLGVHEVDALLWLTGEPITEVQAMTATTNLAVEVEDVVSVSVRYASGAVGTIHLAYALPRAGGEGHMTVRGTEGSVTVRPDGSWGWVGGGSPLDPVISRTTTYEAAPSTGYGAIGAVVIDDLLGAIEEGREPLATGRHATEALRVIDAIYASAASGQRTHVHGRCDERRSEPHGR